MDIKAVCFDIDGTLYPKRVMDRKLVGTVFPSPLLALRYQRFRRAVRLHPEIETIPATQEGFRFRQAREILTAYGRDASDEDIRHMMLRIDKQFYHPMEQAFTRLPAWPDMVSALESLAGSGLKIALLSDFPIGRKLQALGISHIVGKAFCSEESGYLKPHPAPFRMMADALGCDPSSIAYVGDSYAKDIVGSHSVGMIPCLFNPSSSAALGMERTYPLARIVFSRYDEFVPLLESLAGMGGGG